LKSPDEQRSVCDVSTRKESLQLNVVSIYLQFNDEAGAIGFAIETWDFTGQIRGEMGCNGDVLYTMTGMEKI